MIEERPTTLPRDTSLDAARVLTALQQRLTPAERAERFFGFIDDCRSLVAAGVRHRHPEYTEQQVRLAVARLAWGRDLFVKVFGADIET